MLYLTIFLVTIPSIDHPQFDTAQSTPFDRQETVIGDERIIFPVRNQQDLTNHPKAIISYVWSSDRQTPQNKFSGVSYQFDHQKLQSTQQEILEFNGRQIKASWDNQLETVIVQEMDGRIIPSSTAFAFVYPAYFN